VTEQKERKKRVIAALISLRSLFFFDIVNMHHPVIQKLRRPSNVPGFEKTKMTVALCCLLYCVLRFRSVGFVCSPFCFLNISPLSLLFLTFSSLLPSCFLLSVTSPLCLLSPPSSLRLVFLLAFIAGGWECFWWAGVHHGGEGCQPWYAPFLIWKRLHYRCQRLLP